MRWLTVLAAMALACAGCATDRESSGPPAADAPEPVKAEALESGPVPAAELAGAEEPGASEPVADPCDQEDAEGWLDRSQEWVYEATCVTVAWFDGFFGDTRYDERTGESYGRLGLSGFWDERDGFDEKLRFRGNFALPALSDRADLLVGRGEEDGIVEERTTNWDSIPSNFDRINDDSFLVGLGYRGKRRKGFKLSAGVRVRAPPEPYVKLRYQKSWGLTDSTLVGIRPIVYWKSDDKFGSTVHFDIDQLIADNKVLRWSSYGNVAQTKDVQGLEWGSALVLYQAFSNRRALTYRLLVRGETDAPVPLSNYGIELRYRQRVLRDWLFIEAISSVTWPRELREERREANLGFGLGLEAYWGPVPDREMY